MLALDDEVGFDEPGSEAPEVTAAKDRNVLAISQDMDRVKNALNEFDRVSAGLAALEANYPKDVVYPVQTVKGMKDAIEHRAAWRDPRIMVEKARKMAKAPLLALGKSIDARAAWLTDKLLEGEQPIDQLIKAEEARREEEKQARINAEAGRIIAIQESLAEIGQDVLIACSKTSVEVRELADRMRSTQPEAEVFQEFTAQAKEAWAAGIAKLDTALKAKLWDEAEQERIAAEQAAEAERREQEAARLEAQRVENERIRQEQEAAAAALAAERAELERQKAALAAALAEAEERNRVAQQNAEREAHEAKARQDAEEQAAADRLAAEQREAERLAVEESERTAARAREALQTEAPAEAPKPTIAIEVAEAEAFVPPQVEAPTLSLGEIKARIAPLSIDAAGLEALGFPATRIRAACMYLPSSWPAMKAAMLETLRNAALVEEAA